MLPLRCGDKRPLTRRDTLQQARTDAATLARWFTHWPDANIGVVTGEISNLVVLDVDPKNGGDDSLEELERRSLPDTVEAQTGSGGRHLYLTHPGGFVPNRAGLRQGITTRVMQWKCNGPIPVAEVRRTGTQAERFSVANVAGFRAAERHLPIGGRESAGAKTITDETIGQDWGGSFCGLACCKLLISLTEFP